jgi:hypothetical protein
MRMFLQYSALYCTVTVHQVYRGTQSPALGISEQASSSARACRGAPGRHASY